MSEKSVFFFRDQRTRCASAIDETHLSPIRRKWRVKRGGDCLCIQTDGIVAGNPPWMAIRFPVAPFCGCVKDHTVLTDSRNQSRRMPRSSLVHLLSIFIRFVASLSLVPGPNQQLSNVTDPLAAAAAAAGICTPFRLFMVRPQWSDCAAAIDFLSGSRVLGNFHAKGAFDDWQLPVRDVQGTCAVLIEITQPALGEQSSWYEIKGAAIKLNDECRKKAVMGDVSGGVVQIGEHRWIKISLARSLMGGEVE